MVKLLQTHLILRGKLFFANLFLISFLLISFGNVNAQTGKALDFDGTNDYVSLPATVSGSYTKEMWINPTAAALTAFPNLLSGTGTALFLNNGKIAAGHSTGGFGQALGTSTLTAGTWVHIAVTYDAVTGDMKLYRDGVLETTAALVPAYTETALEISRFSGSNFFTGKIDEVRIWSTVRSAGEILASKDCELTGNEPFLLAYYNFNQGVAGGSNPTETTLIDRQNKCIPLNGTLVNFALTGATSNWVAPGPALTGTCANSFPNIRVSGNAICITIGDVTTSTANFTNFRSFGSLPITKTFIIQNTGNAVLNISSVTITGLNAADFTVSTAPTTTVAAGGSTTLKITFLPTGALGAKNATVTINNNDADAIAFSFAITGDNAGPAEALAFDGVDDKVSLPFVFSGDYTKEAWINTNILTSFPNILSGDPTTGTALFLNNGQLAAGHGPAFNQLLDPTPLVAGTWYHVAVTYNATSGLMNLYKDGVLVAGPTAVPAYTETLQQIGSFSGGNYFNGKIDEVRFWNVERTAVQILTNKNCQLNGAEAGLIAYYNFNQGANGGDNTGLTTLNDLHGNCPLNGTLMNFALTGTTSNWIAPGGTLVGSCTPQIANISVAGNALCIVTGDITPSATDNTDFGMTNVSTTVDKTFVITNNGGATLNITAVNLTGVDAGSFLILSAPAASVLPGDTTSFVVRFAPTTSGTKNATVQVSNNTPSGEAVYTYAVTGLAVAIVPVTYISFKAAASGKTAKLSWQTATENNNARFEIQRSVDGTRWETIGYVKATNSPNGSKYTFTDVLPLNGVNAYRLNQVDINGRKSASNVELLNFSLDAAIVNIYPNPVKEKLNLIFNDKKLLNTQAKITSTSGAVVATIALNNYQQQVDMSQLPSGIYFIRFNNGTVSRIIKQ